MNNLIKKFFVEETNNWFIQLFRYTFVGGIAALANFLFLYIFTDVFRIYYIVSNILSFFIGLTVNYLLSKKFVFSTEVKNKKMEFLTYGLIGAIGLAFDTGLMYLFTSIMGYYYMISKIFSTIIVFLWNFIARKIMYVLIEKKSKRSSMIMNLLFSIIMVFMVYVISVLYINKTNYKSYDGHHIWLTASTIKFTNNWLDDGAVNDKFLMLGKPYSIESQTIEEREPYISYPSGTIIVSYYTAKLLGYKEIDVKFVKILNTVFYGLDALLIALIIFLILEYILKLKNSGNKILITIILSSLWVLLPNNVYYLKNIFFSDQLVLFFVYLLILFEILRNYTSIEKKGIKKIVDITLVLIIITGMFIDYYFWIQLFFIILINFINSYIQKRKIGLSIKQVAIYVVPAIFVILLYLFQINQIDNWKEILSDRAKMRVGYSDDSILFYIIRIAKHLAKAYGIVGLLIILLQNVALFYLLYIELFKKAKKQNKLISRNILKLALLVFIPIYFQTIVLLNHSAIHEFSMLKYGFAFIFGIILLSYAIFIARGWLLERSITINKKITVNCFSTIISIIVLLFFVSEIHNISRFHKDRVGDIKPFDMEFMIRDINTYEKVFFSFTESVGTEPPHSISITKKMVYKINQLNDIDSIFPNLDSHASLMLVVNNNTEKSSQIICAENEIIKENKLITERGDFSVYRIK